jgi:3-oxoacyl-[acyl-carrier-protein] synthase-1
MSAQPLAVLSTGLITSVGSTALTSCAAFRAKISNPSETRFIDSTGRWIMAHQVELGAPWRGLTKLARMAAIAIEEALRDVPRRQWREVPLVLCLAEKDRPGRMDGLDEKLVPMIESELGAHFSEHSAIVTQGRVSTAVATLGARRLIAEDKTQRVLIAATDSLLSWPTLNSYEREDRLLTARNSNGFMPGEAAGALLLGHPDAGEAHLRILGLGFGRERATASSEEPLRADGLAEAIKTSVREAALPLQAFDCRVSDAAGELYYFKEASLGLARVLRTLKPDFPLIHPAECTGQTGAAAGPIVIASTWHAALKGYGAGPGSLLVFSDDDGQRAAITTMADT